MDITTELNELVEELRPIDVSASERFEQLATILSQPNYGNKATLNLYDALDPQRIEANAFARYQQNIRPVAYLELVRNGLVLAPILITWYGLWEASQNYQKLLTDINPNLMSQPFLLLWEQGFEGLGGMKFSQIAGLDALLMLGILILTLVVQYFRDVKEGENAETALQLRHRIESILWKVSQLLAEKRSEQSSSGLVLSAVVQFERSAKDLVTQMQGIKDQLLGLTSSMKTAYGPLQQSIQELATHVADGGKQQQQLLKIMTSLGSDMRDLNGITLRAAQQIQPSIDEIGRAADRISSHVVLSNANVQQINDLLDNMMQRTDVITGNLRTATGNLGSFSHNLSDTVKSINDAEKELTPKLHTFAQQASDLTGPLTQAAASLNYSSQSLQSVSDRLDRSATQISKYAQISTDSLSNTGDIFASLAEHSRDTYESLDHIIERMDRIADTLQEATTNADNVTKGMSGIAASLDRATSTLEPTLHTFSQQVFQSINKLVNATEKWERSIGRGPSGWQTPQWSMAIFATVTLVGIFVVLLAQAFR